MQNSQTLSEIENFARQRLLSLLEQCTPEQQMLFNRMYSDVDLTASAREAVERMPYEKVPWAIQQCEQTLARKVNP